jgi:exonuclease SbcD
MQENMRILHTADWHLGDRLGRIDRTLDLRAAVERVGNYCRQENVDVLLVAGDLFSELARPDGLRETIEHWQTVFHGFLAGGGTILTLTGNHDNENFCRTLTHAMNLAAPTLGELGERVPPGRLYLATEPTLLRLKDRRDGFDVQFVLMPYPTPTRYLRDEAAQRYSSPEEKNQKLMAAFREALRRIREHERFDPACPTVLAAHVNVRGATVGSSLFRIAEADDVVIAAEDVPAEFAYVALGHVHKPQALGGHEHVRYSGSIERMDLGEAIDDKSVVVFDVGPKGLVGSPRLLPLESTPIYEIDVRNPATDLPELRQRYPDATNDLVNLHITYTAGTDSLEEVLREAEAIFPRYYIRDWKESAALGPALLPGEGPAHGQGFEETVREYVRHELMTHTDEEQAELMGRLDELFAEE